MSNLRALWLCTLSMLVPAIAFSQASPPPLGSVGKPASELRRLNRDLAASESARTIATLNLTYRSSGDLTSSLVRAEMQSLFVTVEIDGEKIKGVAKNKKPKVREAVQAGPMSVIGRWAKPGKRHETSCRGELVVGLQQVVFLPYGGTDGLSCRVQMRELSDEVYAEWKASFDPDQAAAYSRCASRHAPGSAEFWSCIDSAGVPFPKA